MAVTTYNGHAWLRESEFRTDDMNNTLIRVAEVVEIYAKLLAVFSQGLYLMARQSLFDRQVLIFGRHVMVGCGGGPAGIEYRYASFTQTIESLRAGDLVDKMTVDEEGIRVTSSVFYHMAIPDFIEDRFWFLIRHNNR
jgi:hypothetical protein